MRFRVLMSLLAFVLCLLPSHAKAAEQLQTAWIGEHEAFLVWYAKQKGWDKDAGLDIRMLRFGSGDKIVSRQGDYQWKIAGCGAVPTLMAASKGQFYVVGIGNDESDLNAIYVRPDSPILKAKGANPRYPDVYGSADTVRGKLILCPEKTSAHYLLSTWLHILGLKDEDVKIQNVLPGPAVDMFSKGFGDAVSIWAPATYTAAQKGYQIAASSPDCGIRQPILLLADREFADKNPEQVRAFLRVYLRVVDAMHSEGFDAFVQEYIRFNKTWNEKLMTREEAVEDLPGSSRVLAGRADHAFPSRIRQPQELAPRHHRLLRQDRRTFSGRCRQPECVRLPQRLVPQGPPAVRVPNFFRKETRRPNRDGAFA